MRVAAFFSRVATAFAALSPVKKGILALATTAFLVELVLRSIAPRSRVYAGWTRGMEAVGGVWTSLLLAIVYFAPVSILNILSRMTGKDFLDRSLRPEPSFWRAHDRNPLGPTAAARHQF